MILLLLFGYETRSVTVAESRTGCLGSGGWVRFLYLRWSK